MCHLLLIFCTENCSDLIAAGRCDLCAVDVNCKTHTPTSTTPWQDKGRTHL